MNSRRAFDPAGVLFGVVVPVSAAAAALLVAGLWRSRLPDAIATHWSSGGGPDGYGDPMTTAWVFALVILLIGGGCSAVAALAQALLLMRRLMLVIGGTVVGLMLTLWVSVLVVQLDRTNVDDVRLPGAAIALGMAIGFVLGVLGATRLRDYRVREAATAPPDPALPRGAAVPVRDVVGFGPVGVAVFVVIGIGFGILGVALAHSSWPLALAVPVVLLIVALMRFDVRVDEHGVQVRNFGTSSIDIGIDEILGAKLVEASPFKDFGGWGLRSTGRGRYGIVTDTGPAVEVRTAGGLVLTITSSKAEAMAGALNAYADGR